MRTASGWARRTRRAFWNVPQTFAWKWFGATKGDATKGFPTEAEIVNMNWQHIALGANGLIAYCFHSLKRDCDPAEAPECWKRICRAFEPVKSDLRGLLRSRTDGWNSSCRRLAWCS